MCGKLGHCKDTQNPDGLLKYGVDSYEKPPHSEVDKDDEKAGSTEKNDDKNDTKNRQSKPVIGFI